MDMFLTAWAWSLIPTFLMAVPTTTVYLHRYKNHLSLSMPGWMQDTYEFMQWLTIGSRTEQWCAVHRQHHAHADEPGDPHSPLIDGLVPAILPLNVFKYRKWLKTYAHEIPILCKDILRDERPVAKFLNKHHAFGLPTGVIILCLILGIKWGLVASLIHTVTFMFILNPLINGLCHWPHKWLGGYQHTKAVIALTTFNNWWVAFITGGEGFHHNHHWEQRTGMLAKYWYEVPADWGYWLFIWPFMKLGIITDVRMPKAEPI